MPYAAPEHFGAGARKYRNVRRNKHQKQRAMIYQYIAPEPALREFVRDYLIAHFVFDKNQPIPIKSFSPRPEQAITFFRKVI